MTMKVSYYFEGIGGEWIEFQVSDQEGLDEVEFWKKDSIYLYGSQDLPFETFGSFISKHWPVEMNQIDQSTGLDLGVKIECIGELNELSHWIKSNLNSRKYLNILGI